MIFSCADPNLSVPFDLWLKRGATHKMFCNQGVEVKHGERRHKSKQREKRNCRDDLYRSGSEN